MPIGVSYMGTKRQLAQYVAATSSVTDDGPFLDLFAGICAASQAIGSTRPIWCNDAQTFSHNVASAFFCSQTGPSTVVDLTPKIAGFYEKNKSALTERFSDLLQDEQTALDQVSIANLEKCHATFPYFEDNLNTQKKRSALHRRPATFPYRLFSMTYAGTYLSLNQCLEIDSLRYALDRAKLERKIEQDDHRWACLALCEAIAKCSPTTGHFAQFLVPKESNKSRYFLLRKKSIWREWLKVISTYTPVGTASWRSENRAYCKDALELVARFRFLKSKPTFIYADPPYTDDQYSRYYHLYETLLHYDYPRTTAKARYREGRFNSAFSTKLKVRQSFEKMIGMTGELGSTLMISYPPNGLLKDSEIEIPKLLKQHFKKVNRVVKISHQHSSMGASKGIERHAVTEMLFLASQK